MSKQGDSDYLNDIREGIRRILTYTAELTYQQLMGDIKTQDAVVRNLEIIGEATKKLSIHIRKSCPKVPWKDMMGMRDKMIHHYFGINYEIVWTISKEELVGLLPEIENILAKGDSSPGRIRR
ncbi:MAG TPA: DUF86 domain-containing protein [Thermodesulfobacteriota bacterium]|nr:DUF86 domain-containing protein [Thermodesulfobacteriota bacterium]